MQVVAPAEPNFLGGVHPPYTLPKDAMDRVFASMSPDDTAAALHVLKVVEESRQMNPAEAEERRRRIAESARHDSV